MRMRLALLVVSFTAACAPCCEESDAARVVAGVRVGDHLTDVASKLGQPDRTACRGDERFRALRLLSSEVPEESFDGIDRGLVYLRRWPMDDIVVFVDRDHRVVWAESLGSVTFGTPAPWMPMDVDCNQAVQVVDGPTLAPDCASKARVEGVERSLSREPLRSAVPLWREIFAKAEKDGAVARAELGSLYCREGYLEAGRVLAVPASARYRVEWPGAANTVWVDPPRAGGGDAQNDSDWKSVEEEVRRLMEVERHRRVFPLVEDWVERQVPSTTQSCRWAYAALRVAEWEKSGLSRNEWEAMYRVTLTCLAETEVLTSLVPDRLGGYARLSTALHWREQDRLAAGVRHRGLAEPAERVVVPDDPFSTRESFLRFTLILEGEQAPVNPSGAIGDPVVDDVPPG